MSMHMEQLVTAIADKFCLPLKDRSYTPQNPAEDMPYHTTFDMTDDFVDRLMTFIEEYRDNLSDHDYVQACIPDEEPPFID